MVGRAFPCLTKAFSDALETHRDGANPDVGPGLGATEILDKVLRIYGAG